MATSGAPYAPSERQLPARIGPYRIVRMLGAGSTSEILLARQEGPCGFKRVVVLKVLAPALRGLPDSRRMFSDEAAAYARLSHPAIARLHDFLEDRGELALVLEHVDGLPLNKLRSEMKRRGERLADESILFLGARLFGALAAAHAARDTANGEFAPVVHADVNPSNLVVPWDGYAKLVDFGSTGARRGIPSAMDGQGGAYWAPEQARGEAATARSDVYAACLLLWELFSDRRAVPRGRKSPEEIVDAIAAPQLAPLSTLRPDLPRLVQDVVTRGLAPNPDKRDISAEEVCAILNATTDLLRARSTVVEALATTRLGSLHSDQLETTPSLPRTTMPTEPSLPSPASVLLSERPVVLADAMPTGPTKRGAGREWASWQALAVAAVGLVCLLAIVFTRGRSDRPAAAGQALAASTSATASAPEPPPLVPAPQTAPPPAPAAPAVQEPVSGTATISVPRSRAGHRVWIDHALVGTAPGVFAVSCGRHVVRVGSRSAARTFDLACGDDVTVGR